VKPPLPPGEGWGEGIEKHLSDSLILAFSRGEKGFSFIRIRASESLIPRKSYYEYHSR